MSDLLSRAVPAADRPLDLFDLLPPPSAGTTQQEAALASARTRQMRYRQIADLLRERGPLAAWQIAELLGCHLHQISGRITEMRHRDEIENTGERRRNPRTGASGEVIRLGREVDRG